MAALLAASSATATSQRIDLGVQTPSLEGYFVSVDLPISYEWKTKFEGSAYDAIGPAIMVEKYSPQGELLETEKFGMAHQFTVSVFCSYIQGDVHQTLREKALLGESTERIYEQGYLEIDGHEAYYTFSRWKDAGENRFSVALALEEASREWGVPWGPSGTETPCVKLMSYSIDPKDLTYWRYVVEGKPCFEKSLENLLCVFRSIRIVTPPIAHVVGYEYDLRRAGSDEWIKVGRGESVHLCLGDSIRSEEPMEISLLAEGPLEILGGYDLRIAAGTTFTLRPTRMELIWGKIRSIFRHPRTKYEVRTPYCGTGVRGTDFIADVEKEQAALLILNGSVEVTDAAGMRNITVKAGEMLTATGVGISDPYRFDTGVLGEKYRPLFKSQEEIESVAKAIPEVPLLEIGSITALVCLSRLLCRRFLPGRDVSGDVAEAEYFHHAG